MPYIHPRVAFAHELRLRSYIECFSEPTHSAVLAQAALPLTPTCESRTQSFYGTVFSMPVLKKNHAEVLLGDGHRASVRLIIKEDPAVIVHGVEVRQTPALPSSECS